MPSKRRKIKPAARNQKRGSSAIPERAIFVIRDFEVDRSVGLALQYLAMYPPPGTTLHIPGIPGAAEQGRLIEDIVDPALAASQHVISFMDTSNANVGFELGFALGSARRVALVCATPDLPGWLNAAPLSGYLVARGVQLPKLQQIIERDEHVNVDGNPGSGAGLMFLCPHADEGLVGHEIVKRLYPEWRIPERSGWKLQDLPKQLDGIGEVVWLVTTFAEGADRKDGQGNSLNAVIAGYAKGKGIPLRILKSTHHRSIVDIEDRAFRFTHLGELQALLREAEEKRQMTLASTQEPHKRDSLARPEWVMRMSEISRAVGLFSVEGLARATCFLVSARHVLVPWHVIENPEKRAAFVIAFERSGSSVAEMRSGRMIWGSADVDAVIVELEVPVTDVAPLSLSAESNVGVYFDSRVMSIGHAFGGALSISMGRVVRVDDRNIFFSAETGAGSSGSAVFDAAWNLLAMHQGMTSEGGSRLTSVAIRTSAIFAAIPADVRARLTSEKEK